ncbi:MAG TPA: hypothetical protein VNL69_04240 [Bacteroidota bacterium]|nr:hypothetical protein [Bacteroidota bacterium]
MDIGLLWLLVAAAVGFAAGWLARSQKSSEGSDEENAVLAHKLRERDQELAAVRAENTVHQATLDTLRNEIATLRKRLEELERGDRKRSAQQTTAVRSTGKMGSTGRSRGKDSRRTKKSS